MHLSICQTSFGKHLVESDVLRSPSHDLVNLISAFTVYKRIPIILQTSHNGTFTFIQLLQGNLKCTHCAPVAVRLAFATFRGQAWQLRYTTLQTSSKLDSLHPHQLVCDHNIVMQESAFTHVFIAASSRDILLARTSKIAV